MAKSFQQLIVEMQKCIAAKSYNTPAGLHRLGELCKAATDAAGDETESRSLAAIVRQLNLQASFQSVLISARRVVELWLADDINDWVGRFEKRNAKLHAMHFRFLAELPPDQRSKADFDGWLEKCLAGHWSCRELNRRIRDEVPPRSAGGRPSRRLESPEAALKQLVRHLKAAEKCVAQLNLLAKSSTEPGPGRTARKTINTHIQNCLQTVNRSLARKR